ncbi:17264_t:CDS:1, partial [Racocetra persica]
KVHGYEITGQKPNNPHPEALIELLATVSVSELNGHFDRIF